MLKTKNNCVLALFMFYKNIITILFKFLVSIMSTFFKKYICLYYLCLHKDGLSNQDEVLRNTKFGDLSGIVVPVVLMNIINFHGFSRDPQSIVILMSFIKLPPYYISNQFLIVETNYKAWKGVPLKDKEIINYFNNNPGNFIISCSIETPSILTTLKEFI